MITKWMISIRAGSQRRDFLFAPYSLETPQDTYKRVVKNAQTLRDKYPTAIVDIISRTVAFKPRGEKPHKSWYWCPYCIKWRPFQWDENTGYIHCPICHISEADFYVRLHNNLWKDVMKVKIPEKVNSKVKLRS